MSGGSRCNGWTGSKLFKMGKGGPELASYMEKTLSLKMDAGRHIEGVLRGYDPFLNIVLDQVLQLFLHFSCVC